MAGTATACAICGGDVVRRSNLGRPPKLCGSPDCERARAVQRARASRQARWHDPAYREIYKRSHDKWRAANPEGKALAARRSTLKNFYGLTLEQYDEMLAAQGGGCAICSAPMADASGRSLHVDHDHRCCPGERSCGRCVRGLLCRRCNLGIAHFSEDPSALSRAASYLSERH